MLHSFAPSIRTVVALSKYPRMSRNAGSDENGRFDEFDDFYANYINRDEPDMLATLTILAIFMQIASPEMGLTCWQTWRI